MSWRLSNIQRSVFGTSPDVTSNNEIWTPSLDSKKQFLLLHFREGSYSSLSEAKEDMKTKMGTCLLDGTAQTNEASRLLHQCESLSYIWQERIYGTQGLHTVEDSKILILQRFGRVGQCFGQTEFVSHFTASLRDKKCEIFCPVHIVL